MTNQVFLLGAGRMGLVAAKDLVRSPLVDTVTIGDKDPSRAEKLAQELPSRKVSVVEVDASDHQQLVDSFRGSKVVINAVLYEYNLHVMRAALEARANYNDLGGLFHMTRKQLEMNDIARKAGLTMVLGGGASPGITNVMCAASAKQLDHVQEIRLRVGGTEKSASPNLVFPFAISTIFDEYSKPPVMFMDGGFHDVEPLSGDEKVQFPEPVGPNTCHYSIHSEIATLPLSFRGVRTVDFKLGVSEKILRAVKPLIDAGFGETTPIDVDGQKVSPRDFAIAFLKSRSKDEDLSRYVALQTDVVGTTKGQRVRLTRTVVGEPSEVLGVKNATGLLTGVGASIVAQLILDGTVKEKGTLPPEACIPPTKFLNSLSERGVRVSPELIQRVAQE